MRLPRWNATNGWRRLCETTGHQSAVRAFTSTPPSFSSALIKAEAFSFPKPSATADSRFFFTTCNAGMGDRRLSPNFSMSPRVLEHEFECEAGRKIAFQNVLAIAHEQR